MNSLRSIPICILILSLFACDEIDKLTHFTIDYNETVIIESSTVIDLPFNVSTPEINSNSESTFASNNTNKDLIEYIELTSMILEITSPSNGDFDFLNSIEIYMSAENQSEVKIAWKNDIPADGLTYIELETSSTDLKDFIKEDRFTLKLKTVTDELITSDHHIDVNSEFFVDAKILGI